MIVGTLKFLIEIPGAESFKDKRCSLKGALERARRRFGVAIAEVGLLDAHKSAVVGIAAVSNSEIHTENQLQTVLGFLESQPELRVTSVEREVQSA